MLQDVLYTQKEENAISQGNETYTFREKEKKKKRRLDINSLSAFSLNLPPFIL